MHARNRKQETERRQQDIARKLNRRSALCRWALSSESLYHSFCLHVVCRPSPIAGTLTGMLSEGSQRQLHLCCFRLTGHRSTSKQKHHTRKAWPGRTFVMFWGGSQLPLTSGNSTADPRECSPAPPRCDGGSGWVSEKHTICTCHWVNNPKICGIKVNLSLKMK